MKPISKTAFYCCGVRMQDAESAIPICGDIHAKKFMNSDGLTFFENFKSESRPNKLNTVRHRIIDDIIRKALLEDSKLQVIIIGAGFDSRAFRLEGGDWLELDEPQIIDYKNSILPVADCPNKLNRISINFSSDSLQTILAEHIKNTNTLIVIEGVLMYLNESLISELLQTLRKLLPRHQIVCDLMSKKFFRSYAQSIHKKFVKFAGATFNLTLDNPEKIFINNNYHLAQQISIVAKSEEYGVMNIPNFVLKYFMPAFRKGYSIYLFQT